MPGWSQGSYGYHGDDGTPEKTFEQTKQNTEGLSPLTCLLPTGMKFGSGAPDGLPFGPLFSRGDIIGCGLSCNTQEIFYTRNGAFLGVAFKNVDPKLGNTRQICFFLSALGSSKVWRLFLTPQLIIPLLLCSVVQGSMLL
jgi:hypothetical protein